MDAKKDVYQEILEDLRNQREELNKQSQVIMDDLNTQLHDLNNQQNQS
jgi:hypothetical protein